VGVGGCEYRVRTNLNSRSEQNSKVIIILF
jgi:hypothetical protein